MVNASPKCSSNVDYFLTLPNIYGLKRHTKIILACIHSQLPVFPRVRLLSVSCYSVYITFSINLPASSLIYFPSFCVTLGIVSSNIHSAMKELFVLIPNNRLLNSLSANYGGIPFFFKLFKKLNQ